MSPYRAEGLCRCDFRSAEDLEIGGYFGLSGGPSLLRVFNGGRRRQRVGKRDVRWEDPLLLAFEGGGGATTEDCSDL